MKRRCAHPGCTAKFAPWIVENNKRLCHDHLHERIGSLEILEANQAIADFEEFLENGGVPS